MAAVDDSADRMMLLYTVYERRNLKEVKMT
jgi:hypothetical protein